MDIQLVRLVRMGLSVLSERLITFTALGMCFALSVWVMIHPDPVREIMAGFFVLFVFIPCLVKERIKSSERHSEAKDREASD